MSGGLGLAGRTVALLDSRTPFCLATVVYSGAGAEGMVAPGLKLIVLADGTVEGSLGSAELDEAVRGAAVEQLRREDIALVRLTPQGRVLPGRRALRQAGAEGPVVEVSLEPMLPPPRLVVVGAGHIAVPLVRYARILGFETTVIDDRERFANRERFPDADEIVVDDFRAAIARQEITPWTYLVLVTRGHEHDEATLRHVVDSPAPYIGMIGSRRRVLLVFQRLAAEGVPEHFIDRIYAPIGLDIGGRWPEEIALAIAAEMVNVRRGGKARSLSLRRRAYNGQPDG
ncbi:MAG TPA: XdhC/CoxI family protein [Chloroflexota bacterium]|nr:XdhC/CoxI family protein [Chloroflexota bacterium]